MLEEAVNKGLTESVQTKVNALFKIQSKQSKLVVCTCSILGGIAENILLDNGKHVIRIDRARADLAVKSARKILVLAALESTLTPTKALMLSSQQRQNKKNSNITIVSY
ncbi:hypothetical protein [Psychromonas hadalis]|uniref:hypothetical protein n=1 Tax=Psychromonas hadalis TaxID=211669 RepID=UPI0003B4D5DB|nr:hypothetical protein [Psychromonas hadalis]